MFKKRDKGNIILYSYNFIKKETPAQALYCEFWEISMKTFFTKKI